MKESAGGRKQSAAGHALAHRARSGTRAAQNAAQEPTRLHGPAALCFLPPAAFSAARFFGSDLLERQKYSFDSLGRRRGLCRAVNAPQSTPQCESPSPPSHRFSPADSAHGGGLCSDSVSLPDASPQKSYSSPQTAGWRFHMC